MNPKETGDDAPLGARVITDAQALKALADPLRLRMLGRLGHDPERLWTVKELAAQLGQPATKLYHHMKLLEGAGLVRDAETRLVSGIVEHRYRCAQRSITLDPALFGVPAARQDLVHSISSILDQSRADLVDYLADPAADVEQVTIGRAVTRFTDEERAELRARLDAVIDDIAARRRDEESRDLPRSVVTVLLHPLAEPESGESES